MRRTNRIVLTGAGGVAEGEAVVECASGTACDVEPSACAVAVASDGARTIRVVTDQEQVDALYAVQGFDHELEGQLHEARVLGVRAFDTERLHISKTYELVLDSGHLCIFKPANGLLEAAANGLYLGKQALVQYDHTPVSTTISECAAWQLAKQLGPPWSELVVTTVMKFPRYPETDAPMVGAASVFRGGDVGKRGFYEAVPGQVSAAAFFDALIGQQDRNRGNVLWYEERQLIYLIDHSFSFARAGASHGSSDLVQWRWNHSSRRLTEGEIDELTRLLDSPDLLTLRRFLPSDRADALEARARRMRETGGLVREL
jgi:hypothetical protein